jgi:hypothetical protein
MRQPNRGKTTGAELVYNFIAIVIIYVFQMYRMKAAWSILLEVFGLKVDE